MARLGPRAPYACAASGPPVGHPCPYGPAPCRQALPPASLARLPVAKRRHRPLWPRRRRRRGGRPSGSAAAAGGRGGASFGWSSSRISCSSACSSPPGLPCAGDSAALAGKYPFFTFAHGAASAAELKCLLQPLTNVLPRGQWLIYKGKVLVDAAALSSMQVVDGSKVMLIASQGLHQGDGPITKNTSGPAPSARRTSNVKEIQTQKPETIISKSRSERWKLTGVIALSDSRLKVPDSNLFTLRLHKRKGM